MEKKFEIIHKNGLHARLAGILVNEVLKYNVDATIILSDKKANLKSIMCVLSLGLFCGSKIKVITEGEEDLDAMEGITYVLVEMQIAKEL